MFLKKSTNIVLGQSLKFLLFILLSQSIAAAEIEVAAKVISLEGQGYWRQGFSENWLDAEMNLGLHSGNHVRTGRLSRMALLFSDKTQLRLNQKSTLIIRNVLNGKGRTQLRLNRGRAWVKSKNIPDQLIMETPGAVAAIRGTDWEMDVDDDGRSTITVLHGEVAFYNESGRVLVRQNEQAVAEIGKAPVKVFIDNPQERVQWVHHYRIDPLRDLTYFQDKPSFLRQRLTEPDLSNIDRAKLLFDLQEYPHSKEWFGRTQSNNTDQSKNRLRLEAELGLAYVGLATDNQAIASSHLGRAIELLDAADQSNDSTMHNELLQGKAILAVMQQRFADAMEMIETQVNRRSLSLPNWLLLADLKLYSGEFSESLALLDRASNSYPEDPRIPARRAKVFLLLDQSESAIKEIDAGLEKQPDSVDLLVARGDWARRQGHKWDAWNAYQKALTQWPEDERSWFALGQILTETEQPSDARKFLNKAIQLQPDGPGFLGELGTLETFSDNLSQAEQAYSEALVKNPNDYVGLTGQGLLKLKRGDTQEAMEDFLKASLLEPRYARVHGYLAIGYYQQGHTKQALQELTLHSELDAKDPFPYLLAARIYRDQYQPGPAIEAARAAVERLPYLKSLNQLANDQKGIANVGRSLADFGLDEWAEYYAQESYYPYWGGSHFFLADRYRGSYKRTSELFQGYLTDPTSFGTDIRSDELILKPDHHIRAGIFDKHFNTDMVYISSLGPIPMEQKFNVQVPYLKLNGYSNERLPVSYFIDIQNIDMDSHTTSEAGINAEDIETENNDTDSNNVAVAVGAKPSERVNLFAFTKHQKYSGNSTSTPYLATDSPGVSSIVNLHSDTDYKVDRQDLGMQYRLSPQSQIWIKGGKGRQRATSQQKNHTQTELRFDTIEPIFISESTVDTTGVTDSVTESEDLQLRHNIGISDAYELSWGAEFASQQRESNIDTESSYHAVTTIGSDITTDSSITSTQFSQRSENEYYGLYLSNRFKWSPKLLLQADLGFSDFEGSVLTEYSGSAASEELSSKSGFYPGFGIAYRLRNNVNIRFAHQQWLKPAAEYTLGPVATAGIPLDERFVTFGGEYDRQKFQLEWEIDSKTFAQFYLEHEEVKGTPGNGLRVTPSLLELQSVNNLLIDGDLNSTLQDHQINLNIERGRLHALSMALNRVLTPELSAAVRYTYSDSKQTAGNFVGSPFPFTPRHELTTNLTWIEKFGFKLKMQVQYLSDVTTGSLQVGGDWSWQLRAEKEFYNKQLLGYVQTKYDHIDDQSLQVIGFEFRL